MVKVLLYNKLAAVPRAGQIIAYNFCNTAPLMSIAYELQYKTTHFLTQTGIYFSVHNIVYMIIYLFFPAIFPGLYFVPGLYCSPCSRPVAVPSLGSLRGTSRFSSLHSILCFGIKHCFAFLSVARKIIKQYYGNILKNSCNFIQKSLRKL